MSYKWYKTYEKCSFHSLVRSTQSCTSCTPELFLHYLAFHQRGFMLWKQLLFRSPVQLPYAQERLHPVPTVQKQAEAPFTQALLFYSDAPASFLNTEAMQESLKCTGFNLKVLCILGERVNVLLGTNPLSFFSINFSIPLATYGPMDYCKAYVVLPAQSLHCLCSHCIGDITILKHFR